MFGDWPFKSHNLNRWPLVLSGLCNVFFSFNEQMSVFMFGSHLVCVVIGWIAFWSTRDCCSLVAYRNTNGVLICLCYWIYKKSELRFPPVMFFEPLIFAISTTILCTYYVLYMFIKWHSNGPPLRIISPMFRTVCNIVVLRQRFVFCYDL